MTDRAIRSLTHLKRSASTARVLNLLHVWEQNGPGPDGTVGDPAWAQRPMFRTAALNRAIIIKHRLRRDEIDLLPGRRHVATKVLLPIDSTDLKTGGRYLFVDQAGFELALKDVFGMAPDHGDIETLRLIDRLPTLDPFLLREQLRRGGVDPAACYFSLSEADMKRMFDFVQREIEPLVTLSIGEDTEAVARESAARLTDKILSNASGDQLDALRETLRLRPEQYEEGVFCWKGFLYYKWTLATMLGEVANVADAVWSAKASGPTDRVSRAYIDRSRTVLRDRILKTCDEVAQTLRIYDRAYEDLTRNRRPTAFRDFLLDAPALFATLGDQLGAIQHIVSFWRFRFRYGAPSASAEELIDIFMDFETGLLGRGESVPDPGMLAA